MNALFFPDDLQREAFRRVSCNYRQIMVNVLSLSVRRRKS